MRRSGFTLIETIYATLLMGFIIITLFNLYPSSFIAIKRGEGTLQADALAQNILEEMRSRPFASHAPPAGPNPGFLPVIYGGTEYTPTVSVFQVGSMNPKFLVGVRVTVSWKLQNHLKQIIHETYLHSIRR